MIGNELRARIDTLKRQIRLEDEVRRRGVDLRGGTSGSSRLEGCCPFHDDRRPSLSIYTETQRYYCFGCGATGDVLDFVQAWDGCSLWQALDRLSASSPLLTRETVPRPSVPKKDLTKPSSLPSFHQPPGKDQDHCQILTQAQDIYQQRLSQTPHAIEYLQMRGITEHGMKQSRLGYADGKALRQVLQSDKKQWQAAIQAGLFSSNGKEWLTGRLVIPDQDAMGHIVWMIGRLVPDAGLQSGHAVRPAEKYLGLPLPKGLLGYHQALVSWHKHRDSLQAILLLEGALDSVLARQWELPALPVALLGTHPSRRQWAQLLHLQQVSGLPVIDWHDADKPGRQAALHVHERAQGPLLLFPEIAGVNDLADLGLRPDGMVRLRHAWHALSDSREE